MQPDSLRHAADYLLQSPDDDEVCPFELDEDGVKALAELLTRLANLAPYWHEPYAAPFVPIIESGVRLAGAILPGGA
jgi:hypothetical protein